MRMSMTRRFPRLVLLMLGLSLAARTSTAGSIDSVVLAPSLPESAYARTVIEGNEAQLEARLLVTSDPTPRIGVLFDLAPGWHVYWRNPGESGIAPRLGLEAARHRIGELAWPAPKVFREADGLFTTYGYENRVLLAAPIEAFDESAATDVIRADTNVLVCRTECVPASFTLSTPVDTGLPAEEQSVVDALFREANAQVPIKAAQLGLEAVAHWTDGTPDPDDTAQLELVVRSCRGKGEACQSVVSDAEDTVFLPIEAATFEFGRATLISDPKVVGTSTIAIEATRIEAGEDRLRGLVKLEDQDGRIRQVELDLPILSRSTEAAMPAPTSPDRWGEIFLLALLGGLILNAMPCVLPVLAIKVVAVAGMGDKQPRAIRLHGLAYTGGVMVSMTLLAAVVIALRSVGHSVGWGFQFQEPFFIAAISALLVAFALNLFGVFEIEFGQGRLADVGRDATGLRRSAFEGLLAVVLATPCSAPFLGTAVGFAFATSALGIVTIFLAIGFGLASPFLLVSFFPRLARFIPRSGPWMIQLRAGLGFSLLATVVWLLWVVGRGAGTSAVIAMTGNLLFLAFLLWGFGQIPPQRSVWLGRASAIAIVALAFAGFNLIDFGPAEDRTADRAEIMNRAPSRSGWLPYSEGAVAAALDAGQPAFVVFTADWCITCQINEHAVLERSAIRAAFRTGGFALFKADWTLRDDTIRQKLAEFGRAGVPLYLVYTPEAPQRPQILSELLSQREVMAALVVARVGTRS
jgi:thiol:disulfide interchange protein/DsbC/DsbD-like thiol-disulfide interchange protein